MALHELFGEGFAGLQLCRCLCGAENAVVALGEFVDEADREGSSGPMTVRSGSSMATMLTISCRLPGSQGMQRASCAIPPLPGSADNLCYLRRLAEGPDQRVLTTTTTNYQNLHTSILPHSDATV